MNISENTNGDINVKYPGIRLVRLIWIISLISLIIYAYVLSIKNIRKKLCDKNN